MSVCKQTFLGVKFIYMSLNIYFKYNYTQLIPLYGIGQQKWKGFTFNFNFTVILTFLTNLHTINREVI